MSASEPATKVFAKCRSCDSVFVAERDGDGGLRPLGIASECNCGDGDFVSLG